MNIVTRFRRAALALTLGALGAFGIVGSTVAQTTETPAMTPVTPSASPLTISGYVGTYYAWDNDKSAANFRQFSFIAPRRDQFGLDIAMITGRYATDKVRAVVTVQYGDVTLGWGNNGTIGVNLQEANAGFQLADKFWLDAGFFLTHIGAEAFFPKDNYFSSIALATNYEPFGQSGLRLSYQFTDQLSGQLHFLNGFSRFYNEETLTRKNLSVGMQLDYKLSPTFEVLYDNIIGDETNRGGQFRIYHNLIVKANAAPGFDVIFGLDAATQSVTQTSREIGTAFYIAGLLEGRYKFSPQWNGMLRAEYINDNDGFLTNTAYFNTTDGSALGGLKAFGITGGFEYRPIETAFLRLESRLLNAMNDQKPFLSNTEATASRIEAIFTTGVVF